MHQVLLQTPYYVQKLCERPHVNLWEVIMLEFTEVAVIADNIGGTRRNGAIYKLVVIGVGSNHVEAKSRAYTNNVRCLYQLLKYGISNNVVVSFAKISWYSKRISLETHNLYLPARNACQMSLLYDPGMMTLTRQFVSRTIFIWCTVFSRADSTNHPMSVE